VKFQCFEAADWKGEAENVRWEEQDPGSMLAAQQPSEHTFIYLGASALSQVPVCLSYLIEKI